MASRDGGVGRRSLPPSGRGLLAALVALAVAAPSPEAGWAQQGPAAGAWVLQPGDVLGVEVFGREELSCKCEIAGDGTLRHPLYRSVQVTGLPIETVEARVRSFLQAYEANPHFVLHPLLKVVVAGEVRQPNLYFVAPEVPVFQALALAGGPTEQGRSDRVRLVRGGLEIVLDLNEDVTALDLSLRSGDLIVVDRRREFFRQYVLPGATLVTTVIGLINLIRR